MGGACKQSLFFDDVERGEGGGAGERVAAERATETADAGGIHNFGATSSRCEGQAAAKRFGGSDEIRLDAVMFNGEVLSSAGNTGLDFVGDEQDPVLAADFADDGVELQWGRHEAAFAEDRLSDYGGDRFGSYHAFESIF